MDVLDILSLKVVLRGQMVTVSSTTMTTPYEIVFEEHPRSSIAMLDQLAAKGMINEEVFPIEILDTLDENVNSCVTEAVTEGERNNYLATLQHLYVYS